MHQVIVSPQHRKFVAVRPGARGAMKLPRQKYEELRGGAENDEPLPTWFTEAAQTLWGISLVGAPAPQAVLVRPETALSYSRATWEINRGCNFACDMCVVWKRPFAGLPIAEKHRLLAMVRDTGVLWFQFTGGEPTIDPDFLESYRTAFSMGMMLEILTNGSRLDHPPTLDVLTELPPHKITVSLYGATAETFEALTRTRGAYKRVLRGLKAAKSANLPLELSLIVTEHNAHEVDDMKALADALDVPHKVFGNISPSYDGDRGPLDFQAPAFAGREEVFRGCPAGHTFYHLDPFGLATMCKVGRENPIDLMAAGAGGLRDLPLIADAQMLRTGGCGGCKLSGSCRVCRPLAKLYQKAQAPLDQYCQHGFKEGS
ncbi:radical SAM protein [Streptomyces sp. NPDC004610]|uniref:radical SAM protein n=1 Tax=unclassified Streptomyces TaxID=2593676 RepID=UPI0033A775CE